MPGPKLQIPHKFNNLSDEEFQRLILETTGRRSLAERLGMRNVHYSLLKARLDSGRFDLSSWPARKAVGNLEALEKGRKRSREKALENFRIQTLPFLLVENCKLDPKRARRYIANWNSVFGWLEYKCQIKSCGNTGEHCGKILQLQIDHKNGDSSDNRVENLRYLCPNCHAQTETFCGKGKKSFRLRNKQLA